MNFRHKLITEGPLTSQEHVFLLVNSCCCRSVVLSVGSVVVVTGTRRRIFPYNIKESRYVLKEPSSCMSGNKLCLIVIARVICGNTSVNFAVIFRSRTLYLSFFVLKHTRPEIQIWGEEEEECWSHSRFLNLASSDQIDRYVRYYFPSTCMVFLPPLPSTVW